jgi:hypothetical protein
MNFLHSAINYIAEPTLKVINVAMELTNTVVFKTTGVISEVATALLGA